MKKLQTSTILFVILSLFFCSSCEQAGALFEQEFDFNKKHRFTIPKTNDLNPEFVLTSEELSTNLEKELEDLGLNIDRLKNVYIHKVRFEIITPGATFDPMREITATVSDGSSTRTLLRKHNAESAATSFEMYVDEDGEYYLELAKQPSFTFKAVADLVAPIESPVDIQVSFTWLGLTGL